MNLKDQIEKQIRKKIITELHKSPMKFIAVITGAGTTAISDIMSLPGASKTVIEVLIPYSRASLEFFNSSPLNKHVSIIESKNMASLIYIKGKSYLDKNEKFIGIGCTAAISTIPHRKGEDRAHISICNGDIIKSVTINLSRKNRSRLEQERIVSDLIINLLAESFDIDLRMNLDLYDDEKIIIHN